MPSGQMNKTEKQTMLRWVHDGTPPDHRDGLMEIRSPNGAIRFTVARLAEITMQSYRRYPGKTRFGSLYEQLIEEEVERVLKVKKPG
jgi:hypothetical protein